MYAQYHSDGLKQTTNISFVKPALITSQLKCLIRWKTVVLLI